VPRAYEEKGAYESQNEEKGAYKTKNGGKGAHKDQNKGNGPSKILIVPRAYESLNPGLCVNTHFC
jgi:hypothetical protein